MWCLLQVSSSCAAGNHILECCDRNLENCEEAKLRKYAQRVFQEHFRNVGYRSTACAFSGITSQSSRTKISLACPDEEGD